MVALFRKVFGLGDALTLRIIRDVAGDIVGLSSIGPAGYDKIDLVTTNLTMALPDARRDAPGSLVD